MDTNQQNTTIPSAIFMNNNVLNSTWNISELHEHNNHIILQLQDQQIPVASGIFPNYNFLQVPSSSPANNFATEEQEEEEEAEEDLGAMKEMMYKIAAMQPVDIDPATIRKPKRRNVRISDDPQSVAARHRRERISEKIRILQRLVPGGTKMDTASMLDEAIRYVKFLKRQIKLLQSIPQHHSQHCNITTTTVATTAPTSLFCDWPFAQNLLTTTTVTPTGLRFESTLGRGGSSGFNHQEVISE